MLIEMNILIFENIDFIISTRTDYINSYNIIFKLIIVSSIRLFIKQRMILEKAISILAHSHMTVLVSYESLSIDNYMFELVKCSVALFAAVINASFHAIIVRNDFD